VVFIPPIRGSCRIPSIFRVLDIGAKEVEAVKPLLRDLPDIIVGTPGRLAHHLRYHHI
jgi:superfamily II DNA/RNA helicase